jgi:hypothetical protein
MSRRLVITAAVLACVTAVACTPALAAAQDAATVTSSHHLKQVRDPRHVTGTLHGRCYYRDHGLLPDPRCTPGSIDPAVKQGNIRLTICKSGWTKTVRPPEPQTEAFKYHVAYPAYRTPSGERTELDHLVPLELGGSNDATNLWPEYPATPNPKDKVENALNRAVCSGRVSLVRAQDAIAADWMTAEHVLGVGPVINPGGGPPKAWCKASASPANDGWAGDYDVHVTSDQPDRDATASDANDTWSHYTNSTGAVTIRLWHTSPGESIKVTVGGATCWTTA